MKVFDCLNLFFIRLGLYLNSEIRAKVIDENGIEKGLPNGNPSYYLYSA